MNDKIFISIVTVCYNSEKTIARTFESLLRQGFKDYELIVVDGGSTDGTVDKIKQFEPLFEGRMHWKSEPDGGIYDAFNKGISRAGGQYVWIVNSDDYMEPDALRIIHEKAVLHPDAILCFATNYVKRDGTVKILSSTSKSSRKAFYRDWAIAPHTSVIVPKSIYEKFGVYDENFRLSGDVDWMHRMYGKKVKFMSFPQVVTNFTEGGVSTTNNDVWMKDRQYYFRKNYKNPIIRFIHKFVWEK